MKYLSVCSGIEAATVAWHSLGWEPVGFSEIEPFPSAVLAHHYPHVPNFGDMTKFQEWPLDAGAINLLVGGTPCQSFSVAGLRQGLRDPRGNLMLTYLAIAARLRPRWVVWENVPGVLSSNGGRDFGSFLGGLAELGYGISYRVLDAQWCRTHGHPHAVPQRRRRVFVVGCLGDETAAATVLFERESVQRHSKKSGTAREEIASDVEGRVGAGCWWDGGNTSDTLTKCGANGAQRMPDKDNFGAVLQPIANALGSRGVRSHTELDGHGAYIPIASVAIQGSMIGRQDHNGPSGSGCSNYGEMFTLTTTDVHAVAQAMTVRRLTPRECERLQGFPDDYTLIPWRKKAAEDCPDGSRYKALGNSMAVNCMEWIGERIAAVDAKEDA
jgi:DNA (cytosine-5)-methyltransferase 1